MDISTEIKQIKDAHSAAVIEKAKNEERLTSLNEQKAKIEAQCLTLGIKPEDLGAEKDSLKEQIESKLKEAREKLGIEAEPSEDVSAPF